MRVCMILEGSYPYVLGGVSSWMHQYIQAMPDVEFTLWCIGANADSKGVYKYELPENVKKIHEVFLDDALKIHIGKGKVNVTQEQRDTLLKLFVNETPDWSILFDLFQNQRINPVSLLMSPSFLNMIIDVCEREFPSISFAEFFHTARSMLLPELYLMGQDIPQADIYHAAGTGYSGVLASMARWKYGKPMILTEHGIYTREREEELLRASWVLPYFRQQWIDLFYAFSLCAYQHADVVTALFRRANGIQAELGCPQEKLRVIQNGIHYEQFAQIPLKTPDDSVDIGAVVRISKIKDIKTMIYAFAEVKTEVPNAKLHILGGVEDPEYFEQCQELIEQLGIEDILFTGVVNVVEYMRKLDFTILTSISEGQPLSILESFAARRPCVVTDVGCCRELIFSDDGCGEAGFCVPPMHKERIAHAVITLCQSEELRLQMGLAGQQRVRLSYTHEVSMEKYKDLYKELTVWRE